MSASKDAWIDVSGLLMEKLVLIVLKAPESEVTRFCLHMNEDTPSVPRADRNHGRGRAY